MGLLWGTFWIPTFVGMTVEGAGMTVGGVGRNLKILRGVKGGHFRFLPLVGMT